MSEGTTTLRLASEIEKFNEGDTATRDAARDKLLMLANETLRRKTREMLPTYPQVQHQAGASDIAQEATVRLMKALECVKLKSVPHFLNLVTKQIRWELAEQARRWSRRPKQQSLVPAGDQSAASAPSPGGRKALAETTNEPGKLAQWAEFHEKVDNLPDREKEVFQMRWYHDLPWSEIADLLELSVPTVRRAFTVAKREINDLLGGDMPS